MTDPAKTTAVDDARKEDPRVLAVRHLHDEIIGFNSTRTMYAGTLYDLAVRAFTAEAQLAEQRTTIERLERENDELGAERDHWKLEAEAYRTSAVAELESSKKLSARVAQLEQDKLKLEGELRQEREAREEFEIVVSVHRIANQALATCPAPTHEELK